MEQYMISFTPKVASVTFLVLLASVAIGTGAAATMNTDTVAVQTGWADQSETSAYVMANLTSLPDNETATVSVYYRQNTSSNGWESKQIKNVSKTGEQYFELRGLEAGTEFEYYVEATTISGASDTGAVKTFTTLADVPYVRATGAVSNETVATLNGNVTDLGGTDSATVWFEYKAVAADNWTQTGKQLVTSTSLVSTQIAGLNQSTNYEYRVYIIDGEGDEYLSWNTQFTTDDPLTVSTLPSSNVTTNTATLYGKIIDFGDSSPEWVGFDYRERGTDDWKQVRIKPSTTSEFTTTVDSLGVGTTYEYRAVTVTTDGDYDTGQIATVTTRADPSVMTDKTTSVSETTAMLKGNLTSLGGADSANVSFQYRTNGDTEWRATNNKSVSTIGHFSTQVTGLSSRTDYEFRAVAFADGVADAGDIQTFTTEKANTAPTVDQLSVQDVSPPNPHVELDVEWAVSDLDSNLRSVTVTIQDSHDRVISSKTTSATGTTKNGNVVENIKKGTGETYSVTVTVTDTTGATMTQSESIATSR